MAIDIGPGISISSISLVPAPVLNLDAANYSAIPVNGTTIAGTGRLGRI
jgi:hypothetical protein